MALDQEILVASEAAPGLPRLCVLSSAGAMLVEVAVATSNTKSPRQAQIYLQMFFFLCVVRMLKSFPSFKCTDFVKCVMNNPVHTCGSHRL